MTGNDLLGRMRALLRDTGRGMATASRFYQDDMLLQCLNLAIAETAHDLIDPPPPKQGEPTVRPAPIAVNRLYKIFGATSGTTVPDDFWQLECGYTVDGGGTFVSYVPSVDLKTGERYYYLASHRVYVKNEAFIGPQDYVLYLSFPAPVAASDTPLTTFSDGFYATAKLRACRDALFQEDRDAADRYNFLHQEYLRSVITLK